MTGPEHYYAIEAAYCGALEFLAAGETKEHTRTALQTRWPQLSRGEIDTALAEAKNDAHRSGIEREDTDPSWSA